MEQKFKKNIYSTCKFDFFMLKSLYICINMCKERGISKMIKNCKAEICEAFGIETDCETYGGGHINDTYLATKNGVLHILQRMNTKVFTDPDALMLNISSVTGHLRKKIKENGGNPDRETLHFIKTKDGKRYFKDSEGDCYRAYVFVDDSVTYDAVNNAEEFCESAKAFGRFQNMLADFPAEELHESIKNFHKTTERVEHLKEAVANDVCGRLKTCQKEVDYALEQSKYAGIVCESLEDGTIPYRVTHNDTKLNNVLFDIHTGKAICVIDLDTVMPGSLLYDFGDSLRFGANTAVEDEADLDKVTFDLNLFEAYTKGFVSEMKDSLTEKEKDLLAFSAKLMTYECGIRFLTDYLNGDTYFKIKYPEHNLVRAKNQLKLCQDIDKKMDEMKKIVKKYC